MRTLPDTTRSTSYGEEEWGAGDSSGSTERREFFERLISKANSVPLLLVAAHHGIRLDPHNKMVCPFKHHQGGNERTGSFQYFPNNNSFWCFGCKTGRGTADFVAAYDGITRAKAAYKILQQYVDDVPDDWEFAPSDQQGRQEEIMRFATVINKAIQDNPTKLNLIENITFVFDSILEKYKQQLNVDAIKMLTQKLEEKLLQLIIGG